MPTLNRKSVLPFPDDGDKYYCSKTGQNPSFSSSPSGDSLPKATGKAPIVSVPAERQPDKTDLFLREISKIIIPQVETVQAEKRRIDKTLILVANVRAEIGWYRFFDKATRGLWRVLFGGE